MKVAFWLLIGWWAYPLMWFSQLLGDIIHCGETKKQRKERREFDWI